MAGCIALDRIIGKLDQYLHRNDYSGAQRHLEFWLQEALAADLGKSELESYMCETGLAMSELRFVKKHLPSWARDRRVLTPLTNFAARSFVRPSPYGVTLIMSPWNYPYLLALDPMIDALAAGNTVVVKPSAYSPAVSAVLEDVQPRHHF